MEAGARLVRRIGDAFGAAEEQNHTLGEVIVAVEAMTRQIQCLEGAVGDFKLAGAGKAAPRDAPPVRR